MHRCLQLAQLGLGKVAPNPMVGAVLVYQDRIIGEGYHQQYGEAHAEVNCILSVKPEDQSYISQSTLYVSLEPCAHFGKTPPCSNFIVQNKIPKVVIGCKDVFSEVNGRGIQILQENSIDVTVGVLEEDCKNLNKRFFTYHLLKRPYLILKWAQTKDGLIGSGTQERWLISNGSVNNLVHQWRSEEQAILVGTNTVLLDDPQLNVRLVKGKNPVRLILDPHQKIGTQFKVRNAEQASVFFHSKPSKLLTEQVMDYCLQNQIQSILIEGGSKTLQYFIDENLWDEARIITHQHMEKQSGVKAPQLPTANLAHQYSVQDNFIQIFKNQNTQCCI